MKKSVLAVCCMFAISSLAFAAPAPEVPPAPEQEQKIGMPKHVKFPCRDGKDFEQKKEERKAKMEAIKKEHAEFEKSMDELLTKYNKAGDKKKEEIKTEIKALISTKIDKDIAKKKNMLAEQKERIGKLEERITSLEADKDKHIEEKVAFVTSAEGQAKMKEMREKREQMKKDRGDKFKKGDKHGKKHKK